MGQSFSNSIRQWSVDDLGLSARLTRRLHTRGIRTVVELQRAAQRDARHRPLPPRVAKTVSGALQLCAELDATPPPPCSLDRVMTLLLSARTEEVITLRHALRASEQRTPPGPMSLEEIGRQFEMSRERIRQLEVEALTALASPLAQECLSPLREEYRRFLEQRGGSVAGTEIETGFRSALLGRHAAGPVLRFFSDLSDWSTVRPGMHSLLPPELLDTLHGEACEALGAVAGPCPLEPLVARLRLPAGLAVGAATRAIRLMLELSRDVSATDDGRFFMGKTGVAVLLEEVLRMSGPLEPGALYEALNRRLLPGSRKSRPFVRSLLRSNRSFVLRTDRHYTLRQGREPAAGNENHHPAASGN
jgi:hypothetical protein